MSADFATATNEILDLFHAVWNPLGHVAIYENTGGAIPTGSSDPWARVSLRHATGNQASLRGDAGTTRWDRGGILTVQIFVPTGEGLSEAYTLAKVVADAYEGTSTPSAVWFRNVRVNEVGPDGEWFQVNVLIDFTYDEIK